MRAVIWVATCCVLGLAVSGCGAGAVLGALGIDSLNDNDNSDGQAAAPTVVAGVRVLDARSSPATIEFRLVDPKADPADVQILVHPAGGGVAVPVVLVGAQADLSGLETSGEGHVHRRLWDFGSQSGGHYQEGLTVEVRLVRPSGEVVADFASDVQVGNDPPEIEIERVPEREVVEVATINYRIRDSSDDLVSVRIEYRIDGDGGEWRPARPAGLLDQTTPAVALRDVRAPREGRSLAFFWDVLADLGTKERNVEVRFTLNEWDGLASNTAGPVAFRVDNNDEPSLRIDELALRGLITQDEVPALLPFVLSDTEGDPARVVLQWRRESETEDAFPPLPVDREELEAILADSEMRRDYRIASQTGRVFGGRIGAAPDAESSRVRLPELSDTASALLSLPVEGATFEILRAPHEMELLSSLRDLDSPVAAVPWADASSALVLDRAGPLAWRLRELDLSTGAVLRRIAGAADGPPIAMALEPEDTSALVVVGDGTDWRVLRVGLDDGTTEPLVASSTLAEPPGPVRAILSRSRGDFLVTAGDSLLRAVVACRTPEGESRDWCMAPLLSNLDTPWGMVRDPVRHDSIYLAEADGWDPDRGRAEGRITRLSLHTLERVPLVAKGPGVPHPRAIALEEDRTRLLVVTDEGEDGELELRTLELHSGAGGDTWELLSDLSEVAALATGPEGLFILALPRSDAVAPMGGVQQRRKVVALDRLRREIEVSKPFAPFPSPQPRWRVNFSPATGFVGAPGEGRRSALLWEPASLPAGERIFLRLTPYDTERGQGDTTVLSLKPPGEESLFDAGMVLGETRTPNLGPYSIDAADFDRDGLFDFVTVDRRGDQTEPEGGLTVFFETSPAIFDAETLALGGPQSTNGGVFTRAGDVDGDGLPDIVSSNYPDGQGRIPGDVALFFNKQARVLGSGQEPFSPDISLGGAWIAPWGFELADLDADGDLDIAVGHGFNRDPEGIELFDQTAPGVFSDRGPPATLHGTSGTQWPRWVETADVDGDGRLDIVSANRSEGTLSVLLQKAPGVFGIPADQGRHNPDYVLGGGPEGSSPEPRTLAVADLDANGLPDILAGDDNDPLPGFITVFFQREPGVFGRNGDPREANLVLGEPGPDGTPQPGYHFFVGAADVDGDGDLDIVGTSGGDFDFFLQEDRENFTWTRVTSAGSGLREALFLDLDGDGDLDIVAGDGGNRTVTWFPGTASRYGRSPFDPEPSLVLETARPTGPVTAADLDGDGNLDLVVPSGDVVTVFFQTRPRLFELDVPALELAESIARSYTAVATGDLDGDGHLDVALANDRQDHIAVFFQRTPVSFEPAPWGPLGERSLMDKPEALRLIDIDGDGDLDVVSANRISDNLTIFLQRADGIFDSEPSVVGGPGVINSPRSVDLADLDGDGDLDLVSANSTDDELTVFFQTADGVFDPGPSLRLGGDGSVDRPQWVEAADLDGDGDVDVVSANSVSDNLTVFFQIAEGVFDPEPLSLGNSDVSNRPLVVRAADLDGDGALDLVSANSASRSVTGFLQLRPGVFETEPSIVLTDENRQLSALLAVDLDGDGATDIIATSATNPGRVAVFFGRR